MRTLTTSALLALLAAVATAQPPTPPKPTEPAPKAAPKPDPTDAAIAAALANDADVKMAKAKIQLAEAELAKARQAVTLKVVTLKAKIEQLKSDVGVIEKQMDVAGRDITGTVVAALDAAVMRDKHQAAKAALAAAETELKLLTGGAPVAAADPTTALNDLSRYIAADRLESRAFAEALSRMWAAEALARPAVKGPIPDRIRAALDKSVTLGAKGQTVTLAKALEVFKKDAGLDVPVRGLDLTVSSVVSQGEELPVVAWFQVFQDQTGMTVYVREYGLFFADKKNAPPDAPTLTEFWKQKPPASKDATPKK